MLTLALLGALALTGCKLPAVVDSEAASSLPEGAPITETTRLALSGTEIEIYLRDSTLSHRSEDLRWHVYVGADGSLTGLARARDGSQVQRARGRWEVSPEGLLCRQWEGDWGGGLSGCATVFQYGNEYAFVPQGADPEEQIRRRRTPGDSEGIL
ncbi:MAG: hypothetical protein AAFP17_17830 [Pseudomonadota bacterium]